MSKDKKDKEILENKSNTCECPDCEEILKNLQEQNKELDHKYKRALADYQNLLKNSASEKSDFLKYSLEAFLLEILPVYDNLKMSINTLKEEDTNSPWVEGVKYVIKQFQDILFSNGVSEIKTIGEKFDYNTMEAVEGAGEKVVSELRPGYVLNKKVIIPAKVVVEPLTDNNNID